MVGTFCGTCMLYAYMMHDTECLKCSKNLTMSHKPADMKPQYTVHVKPQQKNYERKTKNNCQSDFLDIMASSNT